MAGIALSPWEQIVAAALAAGPDAVVSHASAAAVHRFEYGPLGTVELTLPRQGRSRPPGVTVHRSTDLAAEDIVERNGVLVTSAPRTLVDLAGRLGPAITEKLLDEGLIERRWTVEQLQDCLNRARQNVPGRAKLRELLALRAEEPNADSVLESRVFRALEPLMPFEVHFSTVLGGRVYVIDAAWPEDKVGAEVVGRAHRVASRSAFDRERRKLNELAAFGWKIAHLTAVMSAEEMIAAVRSLLGPTRSASGPAPIRKTNKTRARRRAKVETWTRRRLEVARLAGVLRDRGATAARQGAATAGCGPRDCAGRAARLGPSAGAGESG